MAIWGPLGLHCSSHGLSFSSHSATFSREAWLEYDSCVLSATSDAPWIRWPHRPQAVVTSIGLQYQISQYSISTVKYSIYLYTYIESIYLCIYIICMYVSFIWSILKLWTKAMTLPLATGRLWRPALLDFRCVILVATFGESQADQEAQGLSRMVFDSDGMVVVVASRKQAISRISGASRCGGLCKAEE